jgi:hypothetical protein
MLKQLNSRARTEGILRLIYLVIQSVLVANFALVAVYFLGWQKPFQWIYGDSLWTCIYLCAFLVCGPERLCLYFLKRLQRKATSPQPGQ